MAANQTEKFRKLAAEHGRCVSSAQLKLVFHIMCSDKTTCMVRFRSVDREIVTSCTCAAGRRGSYCKHRTALVGGDVTSLVSNNVADVQALASLVAGTAIGEAHRILRTRGLPSSERALLRAVLADSDERQVAGQVRMRVREDIEGTGIRAGMVGSVVESQDASGQGEHFTAMTGRAYLVRFARSRLEGWKLELMVRDPMATFHLPIGAELWLRESEVDLIRSEEDSAHEGNLRGVGPLGIQGYGDE